MKDLRRIQRRIEDAIEFHGIHSSEFEGNWDGFIIAPVVDTAIDKLMHGPRSSLAGYLEDIKNLTGEAKERAQKFCWGQDGKGKPAKKKQEDFYHDNVPDPVGLETPVEDVVHMLRDPTQLRVVAISSQGTSSGRKLARAAYHEVIKTNEKEFLCKAWVTASRDDDNGNGLIKGILDELGQERQGDLCSQQLKDFLNNKRCSLFTSPFFLPCFFLKKYMHNLSEVGHGQQGRCGHPQRCRKKELNS